MERYNPTHQVEPLNYTPSGVQRWTAERVPQTHNPNQPEYSNCQSSNHIKTNGHGELPAPVSAIVAPYNAYLHYLLQTLEKIQPHVGSQSKQPKVEETYETTLGILTFSQLHERTRKYSAHILNNTFQMHPSDIDDGLQAGYMHLWERLKQNPSLLKDKQMAWIGKGIAYKALHAIRGDWKYRKNAQAELGGSSPHHGSHSPESRQTDIRIDLHQAIAKVANDILTQEKGKQANRELWALYGLTMIHVSASELSRMFQVREQSMNLAYNRIRERLKAELPNYVPHGQTKPVRKHGPETLPKHDMTAIRQANKQISDETYKTVCTKIAEINADTHVQDHIALDGIRKGITVSAHARANNLPQYQMQRAYKRVHLMIAAEQDPTVRTLRPEKRNKFIFKLTTENAAKVEQLALELLNQSKSYEKMVALHAHISNLAISTTAKNFNIPTSTLRYYSQQIGKHLNTPIHRQNILGDVFNNTLQKT